MSAHPYSNAAPHRLWRKSISALGPDADPVVDFPFRLTPSDKVVAAGSCFAQHISGRLRASGYNFFVTETAHPLLPPETVAAYNYGRFSARYGNIYTARQLLQLFRRVYGRFAPFEDMWIEAEDRIIDPFRPQIQPDGFASEEEFQRDRKQHFAAIRQAFEQMDVFVFTLGLTECWEDIRDGAVFPICPGVAGGVFDPHRHRFRNQDVIEVVGDLSLFLQELRQVNQKVRVVLTVSPVPLVATAGSDHVLSATVYAKAVLRVAAGAIAAKHGNVAYFPSYEIITGPQARGRYFADDLRSVTEAGVDRVMTLFFRHVAGSPAAAAAPIPNAAHHEFATAAKALNDALCDEELLDVGS